MFRCVRPRFTLATLIASALIATPVSIANHVEVPPGTTSSSEERRAVKAGDVVFADGFELGNTSAWSNGTTDTGCQTSLVMPTDLAE